MAKKRGRNPEQQAARNKRRLARKQGVVDAQEIRDGEKKGKTCKRIS